MLRRLNAPDHILQREEDEFDAGNEEHFVVLPDLWPTVETFLACIRTLQANRYIPATEIESAMRILRVPVRERPEMFEGIRLIEAGYLEQLNTHGPKEVRNSAAHHRRQQRRR